MGDTPLIRKLVTTKRLAIAAVALAAVLGAFAPLSSNAICERTAMDKAKVSRAIASLLKRGDTSANVRLGPGDVIIIPESMF